MLINITITINKTHNIYDLIYAASTYDFVNIVMVIKHFHDLLMNYSRREENMNILWTRIRFDLLKVSKITTKFLTWLKLSYMLKHKD